MADFDATWQTTFQQLGPTSAALLRLTAFLAPDSIPVEMFEKGAGVIDEAAALFCEETGRQPAPCPVREALAELAASSLITLQDEERFAVHPMAQEALRSHIPADRLRAWIEQALRIVNASAAGDTGDLRTWPLWDLLRPHISRIVVQADEAGIAEPTGKLMNDLGLLLKAKGLYDDAEPLLRRALDINEQAFGTEHHSVAIRLNNLALLLQATDRPAEAEPLIRRALGIAEKALGTEHPKVAIALNNLAQLLQATGRLAEAEPLMRRALEIWERSLPPGHPWTEGARENLKALLEQKDTPGA